MRYQLALFGAVLFSLTFVAREATATETHGGPRPGDCSIALTLGGVGGAVLYPHLEAEGIPEIGGALVCRLTKRVELLVELAGGPLLKGAELPEVTTGSLSVTTALLYEPVDWVRFGAALTPSLHVSRLGVGGALMAGPAVQFSIIKHRLDAMLNFGTEYLFPHHAVGAQASLHFEVVLGKVRSGR